MILTSKPYTLKRYWMLVKSPYSQLREFQFEIIKNLTIEGKCLELGGTKKSAYRYHDLLNIKGTIVTLNASQTHSGGADIIADCNEPLPLSDGEYDTVISFNLFEHVINDHLAVTEMMRVLKDGGVFHIMVPLMYKIHGAPFDFHRHSSLWWNETLIKLGLKDENFTVEPLVWGRFATGASFFELCFKHLQHVVRFFFCLPDPIINAVCRRRDNNRNDDEFAVGLYITGIK